MNPVNKPYVARLQELGVLEKFIDNCNTVGHKSFARHCEIPRSDFWNFVASGFIWQSSPEEHEYWDKIARS
jgi:hypothetical protein